MLNQPFKEVKAFVKRQANLGKYKATTASNLDAACTRILGVLEEGKDTVGYVRDHLGELVTRYGNRNPKVGKASLDTYRARISRAIDDYIAHKTDPEWQPPSRQRPTKEKQNEAEKAKGMDEAHGTTSAIVSLLATAVPDVLRHRFPLRPGLDIEVLLPRDFTSKEARRVTAWISALVAEPEEAGA